MILQSLYELYARLAENPSNGLPKPGYSLQNITFRIILREDGSIVEIQDARREEVTIDKKGREKKKQLSVEMLVPGQTKPTGQGINPCTLWDNLTYLCGFAQPDKDSVKAEKNRIRAPRCFDGSKEHHISLFADSGDISRLAVSRYFSRYTPNEIQPFIDRLPEDARLGNGIFQLTGRTNYAHIGYEQKESSLGEEATDASTIGQCLITGKIRNIARLHEPKIKTFDPKGSLLVSFNERAYESFAKEDGRKVGQGRNSPVSEEAAFAYCNALNWLLARKDRRFRIGDATTVFWTNEATEAETLLPWMISGVPVEDEDTKKRIHDVLAHIARGTLSKDELGDPKAHYFILGLSPNASRLSVRFWHTGTLGELITNLKLHFDHLRLVRQWDESNSKNPDPATPSVYQLLMQTSRDADGIPPLLGGSLMRAILLGTTYPESLVTAVINRIRAERDINYLKASILKAWLIRNHKTWLEQQNITMKTALDKENPSVPYQLGRLFAVYEQIQRAAHEFKLERTIRETMFSAASATPQTVFGRIDRLNKHHLAKLTQGSNRYYSDLIDEIHQKVIAPTFYPASLNLKEQSLFCIGYYHQRHDLLPKKDTPATNEPASV